MDAENNAVINNNSSAVAEMGDCLATIDMGQKLATTDMSQKVGGCCARFL